MTLQEKRLKMLLYYFTLMKRHEPGSFLYGFYLSNVLRWQFR